MVQEQFQIDHETQRLFTELFRLLTIVPPHYREISNAQQIVFQLDDVYYIIPAQQVHVIHPLQRYTPLPHTRPWIVGVVSVRNRLLIVLDIRPLLRYGYSIPKPDSVILWVSLNGVDIGLLADSLISASNAMPAHMSSEQAYSCRVVGQ
jgi:chemotaxis signal transduction protein